MLEELDEVHRRRLLHLETPAEFLNVKELAAVETEVEECLL